MTGRVLPATAAVYFPWEEISQTPNVAPISALRGAYKLMTQLHYPVDIISYHNINAGELPRYKVLLLPLSRHLRPEVAEKIVKFVRSGGILITEYQAGKYDEFHRETDSLRSILGGKSLGTTDEFQSFDTENAKGIRLYAPITKESPFGWQHRPNIARSTGRKKSRGDDAKILARFPDGSPAVTERAVGRGKVLYLAGTFFNSYRNYFYTLNTLPSPATRERDHPCRRSGVQETAQRISRPLRAAPAHASDARLRRHRTDDSPFQILSRYGNGECILFGIANWGPHERHQVAFEADVPFEIKRLFVMDTVRETLAELPFECETACSRPHCRSSKRVSYSSQCGMRARCWPPPHSPGRETGHGSRHEFPAGTGRRDLQLRVDGVPAPLSKPLPFTLDPGEEKQFKLPPDAGFDPALLRDKRGERLPWYVWITYDGDARAFARVHANPEGLSAP